MYLEEYIEVYGEEEGTKKYHQDLSESRAIKAKMSFSEVVDFLNTPYLAMSEMMQVDMTKRPTAMTAVKMFYEDDEYMQVQTPGSRIFQLRHKMKKSRPEFARFVSYYGEPYNTKLTVLDLENYELYNVTPKIDKMKLISLATGVSIDYLSGYGSVNITSNNNIVTDMFNGKFKLSKWYLNEIARRTGIQRVA